MRAAHSFSLALNPTAVSLVYDPDAVLCDCSSQGGDMKFINESN